MLQRDRADVGRRLGALTSLLALTFATGCAAAPDPRPQYAAPDAPAAELATLKCDWRYDVIEVDGAKVAEAPVKFYFANGNTVKVEPGERTVAVSFTGDKQYTTWRFGFEFLPGHVYKIGAPGGFTKGVRVTNKTTTTSTVIR